VLRVIVPSHPQSSQLPLANRVHDFNASNSTARRPIGLLCPPIGKSYHNDSRSGGSPLPWCLRINKLIMSQTLYQASFRVCNTARTLTLFAQLVVSLRRSVCLDLLPSLPWHNFRSLPRVGRASLKCLGINCPLRLRLSFVARHIRLYRKSGAVCPTSEPALFLCTRGTKSSLTLEILEI